MEETLFMALLTFRVDKLNDLCKYSLHIGNYQTNVNEYVLALHEYLYNEYVYIFYTCIQKTSYIMYICMYKECTERLDLLLNPLN